MPARFSIGIDLGTTNSALAYVPLTSDAPPETLAVAQWETPDTLRETPTLPSFLYLPEDALAADLRGRVPGTEGWIAGRLARRRAGETPGRVVRSAKSWLCHHAADRSAPILPWGSEDLAPAQKISPVRAAAFILNYLRGAWDRPFAGSGCAFDDAGNHHHGARLVRRRRAAAHAGCRGGSRFPRERAAAGGAAGGLLLLAAEQHACGRPVWEGLDPHIMPRRGTS